MWDVTEPAVLVEPRIRAGGPSNLWHLLPPGRFREVDARRSRHSRACDPGISAARVSRHYLISQVDFGTLKKKEIKFSSVLQRNLVCCRVPVLLGVEGRDDKVVALEASWGIKLSGLAHPLPCAFVSHLCLFKLLGVGRA